MWQQILAVLLVLALLIGTLVLLRRKGIAQFSAPLGGMAAKSRQMRVVERLPLGPQHALVLVNVHNSTYLIGLSPQGCNKLDVLTPDTAPLPETNL
ncbi:MAG TPA: flagellar biosynthetic protein FliO [Bryobacteraceae bacterium]|jgi:flagellar biosynthetic protein FliO|nr:flagellar biosynthetic protein FliO [Bryobacteraceae bacterium]